MMRLISIILLFLVISISSGVALDLQEDTAKLYDQAIAAMDGGNYRSAELIFRIVIEQDDAYKERAWFELARCLHFQKNYISAIYEFNRYLLICKDDQKRRETRYWIARSYYLNGNRIRAIEEYKRFLSEETKNTDLIVKAYRRIGFIYFSQYRYEEAIHEWQTAKEFEPPEQIQIDIELDITLATFFSGKHKNAESMLALIKKKTADAKVIAKCNIIYGRIYQSRGEHKKAISYFKKVDEALYPEKPLYNALYFEALSYITLGDNKNAVNSLSLFIEYSSERELLYSAQLELAKLYFNEGSTDKAKVLLFDLTENAPVESVHYESIYYIGRIYFEEGDLFNARYYTEKILSYDISYSTKEAYILLSDIYVELTMYDEAKVLLLNIKDKLPYDSQMDRIQYKLSYVHLKQGHFVDAINGFELIKKFNPFSQYINESLFFIGLAHYEKKNYIQASHYLQNYINKEKIEKRYEAHSLLVQIALYTKNRSLAKRRLDAVIRLYPEKSANTALIDAYIDFAKKNNISYEEYELYIISYFPDSQASYAIYKSRADTLYAQKKYLSALKEYKALLRHTMSGESPRLYTRYAEVLYALERYTEVTAITVQSDADPSFADLYRIQAKSYQELSQFTNALNKYKAIKDSQRTHEDNKNICLLYLALNATDEAADYFNRHALGRYQSELAIAISDGYIKSKNAKRARLFISHYLLDNRDEPVLAYYAEFLYNSNEFEASLEALSKIEKNLTTKYNLEVQIYFASGQDEQGYEVADASLTYLSEKALTQLIEKAYNDKKYERAFKYLQRYQNQFKSSGDFVNLYAARISFEKAQYKSSYRYYQKLGSKKFQNEKLYYLALINLHYFNNKKNAAKIFKLLVKKSYDSENFIVQSQLEYALILLEDDKTVEAKEILSAIATEYKHEKYRLRASHLLKSRFGEDLL